MVNKSFKTAAEQILAMDGKEFDEFMSKPAGDDPFIDYAVDQLTRNDKPRRSYRSSTGHVLEEYGDPVPGSKSPRTVFLDGVEQDRSFNELLEEMRSGES